jgi:hypothetical protein
LTPTPAEKPLSIGFMSDFPSKSWGQCDSENRDTNERTTRMKTILFAVETEMGNSWENCWADADGRLRLFYSREEAERQIKDLITDCIAAVEAGDMQDSPDPSEYRIVELFVEGASTTKQNNQ